ncbi:MAG: enoyl-CoA hydratase/isomerase family protein [Micromonosporaceae bacterium]
MTAPAAASQAASPGVRLDRDGPVATVTLCNPETLNPQTPALWLRLREIGRELPGDVRVVVVRGEGRAFSAGLDKSALTGQPLDGGMSFPEMAKLPGEELERLIASYQEGFGWLRRPDVVSVAAVQGHAVGAGFQLALACDLRVVADDVKFSMAEIRLGLVPDLGGTKRLVELVGYARALELCLTARRVEADEAYRTGLASLVVSRDALDSTVADLASALVAAPHGAVSEIKALIGVAAGHSYPEQEAAERAAQARRIRDLADLGE